MKRFFIFLIILIITGCSVNQEKGKINPAPTDPVVEITYWQFWTGFEEDAIKDLVNRFNKTHKNIKVKMLTISEPWKKILLSIIGGVPPDIANISAEWISELGYRSAIIPLDEYCKEFGVTKDLFIPVYWEMLTYGGKTLAIPLTPSSTALFWNKNLFKKAGLNPNKPPITLEELEDFADKLTIKNPDGKVLQAGFFPNWPPWSNSVYPLLFGGDLVDLKAGKITANNPKNIESWEWAQNFVRKIGSNNLQSFQESFGNLQGPNNPFYSEKIVIEINGVWEENFISKFAPNIDFGVSPIPTKSGNLATSVICDGIAIPKGAKHPKEAFEFIKWLYKPENIEELCIKHKKFSPLVHSDRKDFINNHPNPYIKVFIDLARSKHARYFPATTAFQLYKRELKKAFELVMRLEASPEDALNEVQRKIDIELDRLEKYERKRALSYK